MDGSARMLTRQKKGYTPSYYDIAHSFFWFACGFALFRSGLFGTFTSGCSFDAIDGNAFSFFTNFFVLSSLFSFEDRI